MTNEQILSILFPEGETSIGQMEEYEETLALLATPEGKARLEAVAKGEMYYDFEHDKYISRDELKKEWEYLWKNGETETPTFEGYLRNCLDKNGTLEEVGI